MTPTDTNKLPAEVLAEALKPFLPIMITENRDYAEVAFGDHQTQAMTMAPQDWIALEAAAEAFAASPGPALEAENARLLDALLTADAWLERWASHVGNCRGAERCTCGLTAVRSEVGYAIARAKGE